VFQDWGCRIALKPFAQSSDRSVISACKSIYSLPPVSLGHMAKLQVH
jgi:hypothetical protein